MIDTVVLSIPWDQYTILEPDNFKPSIKKLVQDYSNNYSLTRYIKNPTSEDKKTGNYFPRLTIQDRFTRNIRYTPLRVEFSAPKLLFGNNLKEVTPQDLDSTLSILGLKLFQMGIKTTTSTLTTAEVINSHFCRNIYLSGGYTSQYVMRQLYKLNPSKKLDFNYRHFKNNGQALYTYSNTNQSVFYDKLADLTQPKKRSIDFHQNDYQLNFFGLNKKEVLRWEIRLTHKNKLLSVVNKLGYQLKAVPFSFLFSQKLANQIFQNYWSNIYSPEANLLFQTNTSGDILDTLIIKGLNLQKALQTTTLMAVAQQKGIRCLRNILETNSTARHWYRLNQQLQEGLKLLDAHKPLPFINDIETAIGLYK